MNATLIAGIYGLIAVLILVVPHDDDWLLAKLKWMKRQDKDLQLSNPQIVAGCILAFLIEGALGLYLKLPNELNWVLGILSVYLPITFYFNCVVFHCGARRELIFACVFLIACGVSLLVDGWLRLEFIIPATSLLTIGQCYGASRDPYTHYRKGLRILHRRGAAESALAAFRKSEALGMTEDRVRFHVARALIANQQTDEARKIVTEILQRQPQFVECLQQDALFESCWLDGFESVA